MPKLGVNIDHVATLRQARREFDPDPVEAARICERAGANSIVAHLREDRRHIRDKDVRRLKESVKSRLNLEMSLNPEIVEIAAAIRPHQVTLVPEKRQEITTEGGLDVVANASRIKRAGASLTRQGIGISLFVDPDPRQIKKTKELGIGIVELHTGGYARASLKGRAKRELDKLRRMTGLARELGLVVNAGHGLNYDNTQAVAGIEGIEELNIGHAIVSRAVFVGLKKAVKEMVEICKNFSL